MPAYVTCPNCGQKVSAENDFCIFCGTKLPATAVSAEPPVSESPSFSGSGKRRTCGNGHVCCDDELTFCPECGLPLDPVSGSEPPAPPPSGGTWSCPRCGDANPADMDYCRNCGTRRPGARSETETKFTIPAGMAVPSADDLRPKKAARK